MVGGEQNSAEIRQHPMAGLSALVALACLSIWTEGNNAVVISSETFQCPGTFTVANSDFAAVRPLPLTESGNPCVLKCVLIGLPHVRSRNDSFAEILHTAFEALDTAFLIEALPMCSARMNPDNQDTQEARTKS